jgi:hypothetical protein
MKPESISKIERNKLSSHDCAIPERLRTSLEQNQMEYKEIAFE